MWLSHNIKCNFYYDFNKFGYIGESYCARNKEGIFIHYGEFDIRAATGLMIRGNKKDQYCFEFYIYPVFHDFKMLFRMNPDSSEYNTTQYGKYLL